MLARVVRGLQMHQRQHPEIIEEPVTISRDEWFAISNALEEYHSIFYKVWQMGKPIFTNDVETAAIHFDEIGGFVNFLFNPKFWKTLDFRNKLFVISHEALHVILNHGVRTQNAGKLNRRACNTAMDIVVNHSLINSFGFSRNEIINQEKLCWVDTVYAGRKTLPPDNETYEYYYNLFEKVYGMGGPGDGDVDPNGENKMGGMSNGEGTVDDHSYMGDSGEAIDKIQQGLSDEELQSVKDLIEKHCVKPEENKNKQAGTGTGVWVFAAKNKIVKKKKWETIIKKWASKYLIENFKDTEQWARLNRRLSMLKTQMFLPSDMEIYEQEDEKRRVKVYFFLDTSGSCYSLKDRFWKAAESLPEDRFDVRLFCFDTAVQETTLESRKIYGGGGTSFKIIEDKIQKEIKEKNENYPDAVFLITDGFGDKVTPQNPKAWYWFLTEMHSTSYIPKESSTFKLQDFE